MSRKRLCVLILAAMGLVGSPAVRAEVPSLPILWDGRIVAENGSPIAGEIVAYARPAGLGLDEGSAELREIARARTDRAGRYVLRALHDEVVRGAEDRDGWINVMVAAFGDDGSFNLAFDSVAWVPAGGFRAQSADHPAKGRWITTPAERLAAERGEIRALSVGAREDPAEMANERPAVMVLSNRGGTGFTAQRKVPRPERPADPNCMTVVKAEEVGNGIFTKVGEVHLDRDWTGNFTYLTTRLSSFQIGLRHKGKGWSAGGSTSSMQDSEVTNASGPELPSQHLWNFSVDLRYGHYWWKCWGRGDRWYEAESVQPFTWKGGLLQTEGGQEPRCHPDHTIPVSGLGGHFERAHGRSTTYTGAIEVLGFSGSVTTTHGNKVVAKWVNKAPHTRLLCGEHADPGDVKRPSRIRSLP